MKHICIYLGDQQEKRSTLENVLQHMQLSYSFLGDDDLSQTIGYLMKLPDYQEVPSKTYEHITHDLMILAELSDDDIKDMNEQLKQQGISMPRKAMLTKHNKDWYLFDLMKEIEEEHQYFQMRDDIYHLLQESSSLIINQYTKASWTNYESAFYKAYEQLSKERTKEQLHEALKDLKQAKQNLIKKVF